MLTRTTSPIRDQQRVKALSTRSKMIFPSGIMRKSPGTSLESGGSPPPPEPSGVTSRPIYPDERARRRAAKRDVDSLILENTTSLGMAAHDLRHPAAAVVIYSELLAQTVGQNASAEQRELIDSIQSVSKLLLRLLDDSLEFAQAQSGSVQLRTRRSTLVTIVAQCVAMSRPLAARKQMRLSFFQEGKPLLVVLDALKMTKVFNNLIDNAIRYCQSGARIEVGISRGGDEVVVSVHDNGPGIDPTDLRALFIPFQKAGSCARSDESSTGTGLGLAIAKHAVDLHGGRIWVDSEVGKGTTFYVSLPAATNGVKKS